MRGGKKDEADLETNNTKAESDSEYKATGEESEGWWTKAVNGTGAAYEKLKMYPYFVGLFCLGVFIMQLSLWFLPVVVIMPRKFSNLMNFGMLCILCSFALLKGWYQFFVKDLLANTAKP